MRAEKKAWIAAVVDCEGSLSVIKLKEPRTKRGFSYRAQLQVTNTDPALIQHFRDLVSAGSINKIPELRFQWADKWQYTGNSNCIRKLLPQILPYLIVKKRVGEKMLAFLNLINHGLRGQYSPEVSELYQKIKELNRKGKFRIEE